MLQPARCQIVALLGAVVLFSGCGPATPSGSAPASVQPSATSVPNAGLGEVVPAPGSTSSVYQPNPAAIVVAIDPGHGGCLDWGVPDPLKRGADFSEKTMTLAIGLELRRLLEAQGITVVMTREICSWERFRNRRAISSYTGLCPSEHSSGTKRVPGSVTKHGNPRLRAALVECAWRMVRFQPQYPPVKKRLSVLAKGARATGAQRKKAIVAVARHLAVDLWRLHTGRNTAAQFGLTI